MIVELSSLCLSLLQVQQLEPTIDIERGEVNLSADAISSEAIDGGMRDVSRNLIAILRGA